MRKAGLPD